MTADSWMVLVCLVSIALLLNWLPLWRRSSLWFGVTVAPDFHDTPEAARVLRKYRVEMWAVSGIACVLLWAGARGLSAWMLAASPLIETLGAAVAFARGRSRTRPYARHPDGARAATLDAASEHLPGGPVAIVVPYATLAAIAIFLHANWQRLPGRFPVHWGIDGTADRWADRTWRGVDGPLLAGLLSIALLHVLGALILAASPRARMAETAQWTARFRHANLRMIVAMGWTLAALFGVLALNPYLAGGDTLVVPAWLMVGAVLAVTAGFLWPIIRISQESGSGSDGTPDECWKFGQIYYNPNDPALMVEKRFGVGYTINFGNRASWLLIGLLVLIVMVALLL
jgi:uncharacterized protein DUF5808/uncharacterized protein DUF1648